MAPRNIAISEELKTALQNSVARHRAVLRHMKIMQQVLDSNAGGVIALTEEFNRLSRLAQEHDATLPQLLTQTDDDVASHTLFKQRTELLNEVLELNRLLLPKINGMMSLISNELSELKNGRALVSGYKQAAGPNGSIVSSSA